MEHVTFTGHSDIVRCCCYSPDGSRIVSCSDDTYVKVTCLTQCAVPEKNPYSPHGRSSEIPMGSGVLKAKILEAKYEAKLEFAGGMGGAKQKTFSGGSMDIFWNCAMLGTVSVGS